MTRLQLKGKAVGYIDWANVYGWRKSLKREVGPGKLFSYLKGYQQIGDVRLYFGEDTHEKSKAFLQETKEIGYTVVSKPVKYITGDGDFEPLYKLLIEQKKQVVVIYTSGHLGREIWNIERGLFKAQLKNLIEL